MTMIEKGDIRYAYDRDSDVLDVYFEAPRPAWTIELTDNITLGIDRQARKAVTLGFLDFTELIRPTPIGPRSFPITGLGALPNAERDLVLEVLRSPRIARWLDVSTVEKLPDSPFAVTHLEPPPEEILSLLQAA